MKAWPTSGPIINRRSQEAREVSSSRSSLVRRQPKHRLKPVPPSSERKEDLLQAAIREAGARAQFLQRSLAHHSAFAQKHQPIAGARGIGEQVTGEKQSSFLAGMCVQR